jgi:hypothetical protein
MGGVSSFSKGVSLSHRRDNITVLPRFELLYPFLGHGMLVQTTPAASLADNRNADSEFPSRHG